MLLLQEKSIALKKTRAWIEINLDHLEHNVQEIRRILPTSCQIMAVVKANAYGHGMIEISKKLEKLGVEDFAVATLQEGISLRKSGIKGNILILGSTHFTEISYVMKYDLIQTIVDYEYAKTISERDLDGEIKVYIKVNTGMNRLGESYQNLNKIKDIYHLEHIKVLGLFTHLCAADGMEKDDIAFTRKQIERFQKVIFHLKLSGYSVGKIHIQSSYGILNYPDLKCDYVRAGIIMYGVHSEKDMDTRFKLDLKPVLSVKARITSIKEIQAGETVGYGQRFIAEKSIYIASVSIGYADGYPRSLSETGAKVMVNGKYAEVIGRICMDQMMICIADIEGVKVGDIVTLIGEDSLISAEVVADWAGTITNELLSRLGARLDRVVIGNK